MTNSVRADLLTLYHAALEAVNGRRCCRHFLREYEFRGPVALVAIGKAAESMTQGALDALGEQVECGLVVGKDGEPGRDWPDAVQYRQTGHPLPDAGSLQAGAALLAFIDVLPPQLPVLFLLSGGASALLEVLPEGVGLATLQRVNRWLLGSGLDIAVMNAVRRSLSCIKGGRLAQYLAQDLAQQQPGRRSVCLMISDVPGDDPAVIGSGLLAAAPEVSMLDEAARRADLPEWLLALQDRAPAMPARGDACFAGVESHIVARLSDALAAAADAGRALGYDVHRHTTPLAGDAADVGRALAQQLCAGPQGLHLWGGETSVCLPEQPGQGGRNQHLALAAADILAMQCGERTRCTLLCAGTDGSDGPGKFAGAIVDAGTVSRGTTAELSASKALLLADSGHFLQSSGDLIMTGNSGTNVGDIIIGISEL